MPRTKAAAKRKKEEEEEEKPRRSVRSRRVKATQKDDDSMPELEDANVDGDAPVADNDVDAAAAPEEDETKPSDPTPEPKEEKEDETVTEAEPASAPAPAPAVESASAPVPAPVSTFPFTVGEESPSQDLPNRGYVFSSRVVASTPTVVTQKPPYDSVPYPPLDPVDPKVLKCEVHSNGELTEVCILHFDYVGRVLGKGGEMKRDLENRSNTEIMIEQNHPGDIQQISFRGTRRDVDLAKHLYSLMCCDNGMSNKGLSGEVLPLGYASTRELQVPQEMIGLLIGPKGGMVRHLTTVSRVKVMVDHSPGASASSNPLRKVRITGRPEQLDLIENLIDCTITRKPLPEKYDLKKPLFPERPPMGGMYGGGGGMFGGGGGGGMYGGGGLGVPQSWQQHANMPAHGGAQMQGGVGQQHMMRPPKPSCPQGTGPETTTHHPIPKDKIGVVIGKRGVTINDIQIRSGCRMDMKQDTEPCYVLLRGGAMNVEAAKGMIQDVVELGPKHPYAGSDNDPNSEFYKGPPMGGMGQRGMPPPQQYGAPQYGVPPPGYGQQQQPQQQQQQQQYNPYGQQQLQPQMQQRTPQLLQQRPPQLGQQQPPSQQYHPYGQQQQQQPPPQQQYQPAPTPGAYNPYGLQSAPPPASYPYAVPPPQPAAPTPAPPPIPVPPPPQEWASAQTPDGKTYYYHKVTQQTTWTKPAGFIG